MNSTRLMIHSRLFGTLLALGLIVAAPPVFAAGPCCSIVGIDKAAGIVTLRDLMTGKLEKVTVKDPGQLARLAVGQSADRGIGVPTARP
jgi:hypothetical protein